MRCNCRHGRMMAAYDAAAHHWWNLAEAATRLYPAELEEFKRDKPMPQLGDFMKGTF